MSADLQPLLDRLDGLITNLEPAQRKQLARDLARTLRGSQAKRIRENHNPDGSAMEPSKAQPHLRRRGGLRMFRKLQRTKWLRPVSTPDEASVSFKGFANQVARVHHYGLRSRINESSLITQYPKRTLLGLTKDEIEIAENMLIMHLAD